jgi:hypothetical protein
MEPSTLGGNGDRNPKTGRFAVGNKCGRGDPLAGRAAKIRAVLLQTLTPAAAKRIAIALLAKAEAGELPYIRELLDRTIGKSVESEVLARIERLEALVQERNYGR